MYNAMMDPELIRMAQEQMSRISPSELAKIQQQMMSNPELIKMATESMKNMKPEDLKNAAEQLKYARTEDMLEIGSKMANATPEEIAAIRARADAQITYELNAAQVLKKQGNELHSQSRFLDAAQKYLLAKKNLKDIPVSKGRTLQLACSLNLMSCYLKTGQYDECIKEGSEVLAYDAENVKALYRRGQAYKELGLLEDAVNDLSKAHRVSPDDETISNVLRDANERLKKEGKEQHLSKGVVIEEITEEEVQTVLPERLKSSSTEYSVAQPQEMGECSETHSSSNFGSATTEAECLRGLKDDPEAIRSFQNFISNADPETLASLSSGNSGGMSPEMIKTASSMISKMPSEELQGMLQMASSFQGSSPYFPQGENSSSGSLPPGVSPDMLKVATDMMSKMSPDELQKMFQLASSLKEKDSVTTATTMKSDRPRSDNTSKVTAPTRPSSVNGNHNVGESGSASNLDMDSSPQNFPSTADFQELMRNSTKDPAMRQMFTSMIKNMSPEMMANMSEQFGVKLSREDAEKAQKAMSSLSPEDLDRMMRWADRIQKGVEGAKKTKNWLLGRPGMILALCMLILAVILHWLGFIGS
ncbi:PREDICTED: outer envelope protein 61 [Nelumbo nucifera]|uniref:Outer envelope protein 61 n=1 Tax=Nelumbo nucifera TaxID=4432 RepID=A0A1U7Z6Q7_NELNU|nr:PREDICTED: outer envelope protein 61 [Nelumbo nucifera]